MEKFIIGVESDCDKKTIFEVLTTQDKKFDPVKIYVNHCPDNLISFVVKKDLELEIGQEWYIKFTGQVHLSKRKISHLTDKTVGFEGRIGVDERVFKICDVEFVEKTS